MYPNNPLNRQFNVAVTHIAGRLMPLGYDVSSNAPQTFEELKAHFNRTGRICVWDGASEHTIFDDIEVNYAFRAWHDSKHLLFNLPFTEVGEYMACWCQRLDIFAVYGSGQFASKAGKILNAEINGQFKYNAIHGRFPFNQMAFVEDYLMNPAYALRNPY